MFSAFFPKIVQFLWGNVGNYGRARQATDDNITQGRKDAVCMPDYYGRIQTQSRNIL